MENKLCYFILIFFIFLSCKRSTVSTFDCISKTNKDSIIYVLPEKTTSVIMKMISGKKVSFCMLASNNSENKYIISFPYDDKYLFVKQDTIMLNKSNTFLKVNKKFYPLLHEADILFADTLKDVVFAINDFNYCYVIINAQGDIVDALEY